MGRIVTFLPACLLAAMVLMAGCKHIKQPQQSQQTFYLNLSSGNLESMDPAFAKDLYTMWASHMVYNTLVETDEQLQLRPSLARRWTVSPDGLTYTFYLQPGVWFHDNPAFPGGRGRLMTAHDVVYSFNRITDPATASPGAWIFNGRVDTTRPFRALNDTTLEIRLLQPFRPLPLILSMPYCSIVPHELVSRWGKDFRSHPCGTGPFRLQYWDEGNVLALTRNPRYWERDASGRSLPYLDAVQVSFVDSKATEFFLFLQGKLDFVNGLDGSFKDLILSKDGSLKAEFRDRLNLSRSTYLNTEYLGFLTDTSAAIMAGQPTRDPLIRQAINYAIDRQKIVTYFRNGIGIPANAGFIPAGMPGHDTSQTIGYHYNPAKAMELLERAGHPNGRGLAPFTILTPDNYQDIVNFVASQLQNVGIPARVEVMQPNILRQQMSRSQAVCFRAQWIADYPDAETYLAFFHSRFPAPPNYTRFSQPVFDRWYDQSMNLPDSMRWARYRSMDSLAMSQAPVVPLFYDQLLHFTSKRVRGLRSTPMNLIELKEVELIQ